MPRQQQAWRQPQAGRQAQWAENAGQKAQGFFYEAPKVLYEARTAFVVSRRGLGNARRGKRAGNGGFGEWIHGQGSWKEKVWNAGVPYLDHPETSSDKTAAVTTHVHA